MKIAFSKRVISPEIGTPVAGYGPHDVTVCKRDDIYLTALGLDDGVNRALIVGYDLLGISAHHTQAVGRKTRNKVLFVTALFIAVRDLVIEQRLI